MATYYLAAVGLLFLFMGARTVLKPVEAFASPNGFQAGGVDAMSYGRSHPGGATVSCGAVLLTGAWFPQMQLAALILAVTLFAGFTFGRAVSRIVDGKPGRNARFGAAVEGIGFMLGVASLLTRGA